MSICPPDQIKPYLDEIADRLWSHNAAVMVGAGFSRNAKPAGSSSASFRAGVNSAIPFSKAAREVSRQGSQVPGTS